jgi:CelD/BcsL family acetyltransferase involved in cellulose biosynthesis
VDPSELSGTDKEIWNNLVENNEQLLAPCFFFEFILTLSKSVPKCKVCILRKDGGIQGFVAFCFDEQKRTAYPIPLCDYTPIVLPDGANISVSEIVKAAGIRVWHISNLIEGIAPISRFYDSSRDVVYMFSSPPSKVKLSRMAPKKKIQQQINNLSRDFGSSISLKTTRSLATLEKLLFYKRQRYPVPICAEGVLHSFIAADRGGVSSEIFVLMVGETEAAWAYCQIVKKTVYFWFPAFDPIFSRYSPGLILLFLLTQNLEAIGCDSIDFGPGGENYKARLANATLTVVSATAFSSNVASALYMIIRKTKKGLRYGLKSGPHISRINLMLSSLRRT